MLLISRELASTTLCLTVGRATQRVRFDTRRAEAPQFRMMSGWQNLSLSTDPSEKPKWS
jgi:hypothetical protein